MTPLATRIHAIAEWLRTLDNSDVRAIGESIHAATPDTLQSHDIAAYSIYGLLLGALARIAEDLEWGVAASAMYGRATVRFGGGYVVGVAETPAVAALFALEFLQVKGIPKRLKYGASPSPVSVDGEVTS